MRGALSQAWRRYDRAAETAPWVTGFVTCFVKGSAADIIAQKAQARLPGGDGASSELSWRRNVGFALFSGGYTGIVQRAVYNIAYPALFGVGTALRVAAKKSLFDATVHVPLLYMPVGYYVSNFFTEGGEPREAVRRYWQPMTFIDANARAIAIWVPAHLFTFSVCPTHLRIPWTAAVSFSWLIVMSSLSSQEGH